MLFIQTATTTCSQEFEKLLQQSGKSVERLSSTSYDLVPPFSSEVSKDVKTLCDAFGKITVFYKLFLILFILEF